jgi:hypothetical protein
MTSELLQAERDIARLLYDYAAAVDGRDFEAIRNCYWSGGWDDHAPDYCGPVDGYVDWLRRIMPPGPVLNHQVGNVRIDVSGDGESAGVNSYCTSTATFPGLDGTPAGWMQLGLSYVDEVARHGDEWRFQRRRCRQVWSSENGSVKPIAIPH